MVIIVGDAHRASRVSGLSGLGYEKDEEFERCLKRVLVEEELGYLLYFRRDVSHFGPNMPIMYSEEDLFSNGFFAVPEIEGHVGKVLPQIWVKLLERISRIPLQTMEYALLCYLGNTQS